MKYLIASLVFIGFIACNSDKKTLPIFGERIPVERQENGKTVVDTIYHRIPEFNLVNQDSSPVSHKTVNGKIYVADFFFTSCPTICPKVRKNLKRVYEHYESNPGLLFFSHSIDTKYDTVGRLAWYAKKMNIDSKRWHLLRGDKEQIYSLARAYFVAAVEDSLAEGGFDHSSTVALIDKERRVRGLYDGLDTEKMDKLIEDINRLMKEE